MEQKTDGLQTYLQHYRTIRCAEKILRAFLILSVTDQDASHCFKWHVGKSRNNDNNNGNGNSICLFECTTVNLATYRQFTIGCLRLNIQKSKFHYVWAIPIPISTTKQGHPTRI